MDEEILKCACSSAEHQIIISVDKEDGDKMVYCTIHLAPHSFFKRLKNGIKYIFGHRCVYGDFEEFIFEPKHKDKIKKIYDYLNDGENDYSKE